MSFSEFVRKYRNKINPQTGTIWTVAQIKYATGAGTHLLESYLKRTQEIQARVPEIELTDDQMIELNAELPPIEPPAEVTRTPWGNVAAAPGGALEELRELIVSEFAKLTELIQNRFPGTDDAGTQ